MYTQEGCNRENKIADDPLKVATTPKSLKNPKITKIRTSMRKKIPIFILRE